MRLWSILCIALLGVSMPALAFDCVSGGVPSTPLQPADQRSVRNAIRALQRHDAEALFNEAGGRLYWLRDFPSGEPNNRGGTIAGILHRWQFDGDGNIHVRYRNQVIRDFSAKTIFGEVGLKDSRLVRQRFCSEANDCSSATRNLAQIDEVFTDLSKCEAFGKNVFQFEDGVLVVDMQFLKGLTIPVGEAMFFIRANRRLSPRVLISFQ